jgi:hypothetical protein
MQALKQRDNAVQRTHVPMEFVGKARTLRSKVLKAYADFEDARDKITAPFRPRPGWTPMPRLALLRALPVAWRALPSFCRLRLVAGFDDAERKLQIAELHLAPSSIYGAWSGDDEPALAILLHTVAIAPPAFRETHTLIAAIGLHALARRVERGADRSDAAVLRDFHPLATAMPAGVKQGGEFAIPCPESGGRWLGAVAEGKYLLCRTWVR